MNTQKKNLLVANLNDGLKMTKTYCSKIWETDDKTFSRAGKSS